MYSQKLRQAARTGCRAELFRCADVSRGCAETSEVSGVKNATNLRLQETAAGQVCLFPACYLQGAAQLWRATCRSAAASRGRAERVLTVSVTHARRFDFTARFFQLRGKAHVLHQKVMLKFPTVNLSAARFW